MTRLLSAAALLMLAPFAAAQSVASAAETQIARLDVAAPYSTSTDALPDAPSVVVAPAPFAVDGPTGVSASISPTASKYATIILPGQSAVPLHGMEKVAYGLHDAFNPLQLVGITVSAGYSHLADTAPHYGTNSEAFGKREGVAALRSTIQTLATDAVFSPMFHDDPRYFAMGDSKPFLKRVVYAATRVVIVRSSYSTNNRLNAPLLLGYGVAAAANNAYYPDRDRGAKQTFQSYAGSLGGAALGFEVSEFLDDALRLVHIRR